MKKLFVLSLLLFTTDSFATGISGGTTTAPCDNATLSKYTGTVNAEINWEPNTINLTWYDGDTQLNVPAASQTCTYDGMITVPPAPPEKLGYTFNGWKIPKIDFSTIPTNVSGIENWGKSPNYCWYYTGNDSALGGTCTSDFDGLNTNEWKTTFEHGTLYGISACSPTSGTSASPGNPTIGTGQYCWCKATGYKPINTNVINASLHPLSWVFRIAYDSTNRCYSNCPGACINAVGKQHGYKTALFTPVQ